MTEAYPLAWPRAVPRTPAIRRKAAKFTKHGQALTVASALDRLKANVDNLRGKSGGHASALVVSSNIPLRRDGFPRSDWKPEDPGVAVFFRLDGKAYCLPCDRWDRAPDNICAVAWHIDAMRAIERYGVGTVEQAFEGFLYLPPPAWWDDLGLRERPRSIDEAEKAWRKMMRRHHPDIGGDVDIAARANQAIADARKDFAA